MQGAKELMFHNDAVYNTTLMCIYFLTDCYYKPLFHMK